MRIILLSCVASLALMGCQTARTDLTAIVDRQGERALDWPYQESDLRPDPAVRHGRLANGMRYAIVANATPSGTASMRLRFDVGSLMEDDDQRGLAHFLEHMAFNGSANVPEGEMIRLLQRRGLSFGAHTNAYTSFDETVYQLEAPNVEPETLDTTLFLLREIAGNLTIAPDAVDRERGIILSEERARNAPGLRAYQAQQDFLFPGARIAERLPIGTVETISNAPAQRLRDLYEDYYRPDRALLVIVGDIDVDAMEARIQRDFGDWRPGRAAPEDPPLTPDLGDGDITMFHDPGIPTTVSLMSLRAPRLEANTQDQFERAFLRLIANGIVTRRLTTLARDGDANFQSGDASGQNMLDAVDVSSIDITTRPEEWRDAVTLADRELRRAQRFGFTQAEIDEEVAGYRAGFQARAEQAATRANADIANAIVGEFSHWGVYMRPEDERALFESIAPRLTPQAVHRAFNAQWTGARRVFITNNAPIADLEAQTQAAIAEGRASPITPPAATETQAFAYTDFGAPGAVAERGEIADLGIVTVRLANNVRLNVKRTSFADDQILIAVRYGSGQLELPREQPGLNMLMSMLPEAGLEAHSADELQRILAGHNVATQLGVGSDSFRLSARTTPGDLALQLQLMTAYLAHPGYRDEALARFRRNVAAQLPTLSATPNGVMQRDVARLLRSGDERFGIPDQETLMQRDLDEVRDVMARARNEGAIEIGIVGDVDVEQTIALVAATFGALPPRVSAEPDFADARDVRFPQGGSSPTILRHDGPANRAVALVFWPTSDDSDPRLVHTLELLRAVLTLKLTDRIREQEAATYSPSSQTFFSNVNPGYGFLNVSLDLVPNDVERFYGIVDDIVAGLARGDISDDEIDRARRPILEDFRNTQEDNSYWLGLTATAQTDPSVLDAHRRAVGDYNSITRADLARAAERYLQRDRAFRIAVMPNAAR